MLYHVQSCLENANNGFLLGTGNGDNNQGLLLEMTTMNDCLVSVQNFEVVVEDDLESILMSIPNNNIN